MTDSTIGGGPGGVLTTLRSTTPSRPRSGGVRPGHRHGSQPPAVPWVARLATLVRRFPPFGPCGCGGCGRDRRRGVALCRASAPLVPVAPLAGMPRFPGGACCGCVRCGPGCPGPSSRCLPRAEPVFPFRLGPRNPRGWVRCGSSPGAAIIRAPGDVPGVMLCRGLPTDPRPAWGDAPFHLPASPASPGSAVPFPARCRRCWEWCKAHGRKRSAPPPVTQGLRR
jgi:hypothetical protein